MVPQPPAPTPSPTMNPTVPTQQELLEMLQMTDSEKPMATMSGQVMKNATASGMYKTNPFLAVATVPSIGHLESSGFTKRQIKPKSRYGWAPYVESYNPPLETVLNDVMSALISGRNEEEEKKKFPEDWKIRMNTANNYQSFRDDPEANLDKTLYKYAGPRTEENLYAGEVYVANFRGPVNRYAEMLDKIMQRRGGSFPKRY